MKNVPINKIREFQTEFLDFLEIEHKKDILDILAKGKINDEITDKLKKIATELTEKYSLDK